MSIIGQRIVGLREMTEQERQQWGWEDSPYPCVVVELGNGTLLFASRDEEGNGPGALFGMTLTDEPLLFYLEAEK